MLKWIIIGILAFIVVFGILLVGSYAFKWYTLPFQGKLQERAITEGSGAYRKQMYEQFYRQIERYETAEDNYKASYNRPLSDKTELIECRALVAEMNESVNEYNKNSRQWRTSGKFKDPLLPDMLTKSNYTCLAAT